MAQPAYRLEPHARELFGQALERPEAERAGFLAGACSGDEVMRRQLESLLRSHALAADVLLEGPAVGEKSGDRIGPYKLLQQIGEGGFGTVWMAEQEAPVRRKVALKVLKPGLDTAQVIGRFEAERQALALMDHPSLAKVFDGGATPTGRPYFVMELVKGVPITSYCDEAGLSPGQRCELFVQVCHAVQHAHQKGVIHRDLKPSNVLVTLHDGTPVPKVIDFGIAKATSGELTQRTVFTEFRQMLGTPEYMAPEQAELSGLGIDTRADVYSLGVLLYELLTGTRPFALKTLLEAGYAEMVRTIKEVDPPKPSTRVSTLGEELNAVARHRKVHPRQLGALMRGDFDWIVMKALEKERGRRYDTATALAEDVVRHLRHEPVLAGPPSRVYRLRKYVRRHRVGVAAGAAIAVALLAGAAAAGWGWLRAEDREARAVASASLAERARAAEAQQREASERSEEKARSVIDLLRQMLSSSVPHEPKSKDYTVRQLLDDFDRDLAQQLDREPEVKATLRLVMASSYLGLGLPAKAAPHLDMATAFWEQARPDSLQVANCLAMRAQWLHDTGDYREASQTLERARAIVTRMREARGTLALSDYLAYLSRRQAELYKHLGQLADAERTAREGIEILRSLPPEEDRELDTSLGELALILANLGRLREAEQLAHDALAESRARCGDRHSRVAASQRRLAVILREQGKLGEAEALGRKALELTRSIVGEEHPRLADMQDSLAATLAARDKHDEAVVLYREALALHTRLQGESAQSSATTMCNLSTALSDAGHLDEAEELARRSMVLTSRSWGQDHPETLTCRNNLAVILARRGKHAEAELMQREVLAKTMAAMGPEDPSVVGRLFNLARTLLDLEKHGEAEPLTQQALDLARKLHGDEHPLVAMIECQLGAILRGLGRLPESEALHRHALEVRLRLLGDNHPLTRTSRNGLSATLHDRGVAASNHGSYAEAEARLREAATLGAQARGDADPAVGNTRANLAHVLKAQGKLEEAEPLFRQALEALSHGKADNPIHTRHRTFALVDYAVLLHGLGRLEEGERHLRQGVDLERQLLARDPASREVASRLLNALSWLVAHLDDLGQVAECEQVARQMLELASKTWGDDGEQVARVLERLTTVLRKQGKHAEAEPNARRALELRKKLHAEDSLEVATAQIVLARILLEQRRAAEAEPLARAGLAIRAEKRAGDWTTHNAQAILGRALALQGRVAEAEQLLVEACSKLQPPPNSKHLRDAIGWLVELYEADGRTELAASWRARLPK